VLTQDL